MVFTITELFDLVIMTFALGYIFMDVFRPHARNPDEWLELAKRKKVKKDDFVLAVIITAPAVILHELAHKFVALLYGVPAVFHAAYGWLGLGVLLKILGFPFIFFVPGYVSHLPVGALGDALIAGAGPALNGLLWLGSWLAIKKNWYKTQKQAHVLKFTKSINMFLFFFNLIPLMPFDGAKFFGGLIEWLS